MRCSVRHTVVVFLALLLCSLIPGSDVSAEELAPGQPYACEEDLLEVMFAWESRVRLRDGSPVDLEADALAGVDQLLSRVAWFEWHRICDVSEETLDEIQARAETNTGESIYNLNNIYRLRIPPGLDVWELGHDLEALPGIMLARPVPEPMPAPTPPDYVPTQGYLRPASWTPTGIDADYAWTRTGGDGSGVTICDLEYSWNYNHDDITKAPGSQINSNVQDPFGNNNHGTAVLGEMVSDNNGWGTTGICYGAGLQTCGTYYGVPPSWNVPGALAVAIANLSAGDVILLEQQWERTPYAGDYVPIEWWLDYAPNPQSYNGVYAAIVTAVAVGINVVEAGGNGGVDTDLLTWYGDSGAIIVGAGGAYTWDDLQRLSFSSYGSRFNLQGWGEAVVTTGYGDLYASEGVNRYYTAIFGGTSSASPIVTGAVACCTGYWYANISPMPPTPAYVRNLLVSTGTPQVFPPSGAIGPRPDLAQAIPSMSGGNPEGEYGDAPEGATAYPTLGVMGAFPTCVNCGPAGWIYHAPMGWARFELVPAPGIDFENDGNAGNCPNFPPYDADECFNDGDAGLMFPPAYTIQGGVVVPCTGQTGDLGMTCQTATWGIDVDIWVVNNMPADGFVNVLMDWDQNGQWAGASQCPGGAAPEHVLVDFPVPMGFTGPLSALLPPAFLIGPNHGYVWSRFTISEHPVPHDWNGQEWFADGETEDYLLHVYEEEPPPPEGEYGDAPEGATAYPSLGVMGAFPTCVNCGPAGWVYHGPLGWARFELNPPPGVDFEIEGNAGNCPNFPPYDADECFNDGDAGLLFPPAYTIQGGVVVPCTGQTGDLGMTCQTATWGIDVDIFVVNHMPVDGFVNVLVDWDQNGQWAGASQCPGGAAPEHVLVNFPVPMGYSGPLSALGPPAFLTGPSDGYAWSRFTVSETPVPQDWDGAQIFEDGETEDYLLHVREDVPPPPEGEYGDAPEGATAYPSLGVMGAFPTCVNCGPAGWVYHGPLGWARFELVPAPGVDFENEGNAGLCPNFAPYDADECFNDGDAGLMFPPAYTIQGGIVVPCTGQTGPLGITCQMAVWGVDVDIWVINNMPVNGFVNVLMDWDQNGQWAGASQCPGGAAPEHVLVNFLVPIGFAGPLSALGPPAFLIGPSDGYVWSRFTVSEHPVPNDWNGEEWFEDGETEDYLLLVDPDPLGACCIHEAQCMILTVGDCAAAGGIFQGGGTTCDPNPCPYDSARVCCDGEDCYLVFSELGCANLGGRFHPHWLSCNANPCDLRDWADHDVGNCTGTVTDQGIIGFMDATQSEGSGFVYPYGGTNLLFVGSLWVGESDSYTANRDYDDDPSREWMVSSDPDGHVWVDINGESDQDIHTIYTDSAAVAPRGLFVQQESWAFSRDGNEVMDDFIILRYFVENRGTDTIDDAYIGVFLDVDIDSVTDNVGLVEASRNLVYLTDRDTSTIHVGLRLLQDDLGEPAVANLSLIHNWTYVWPNRYILDDDKYGFLSAGAAEYTVTDTTGLGADDYSILASAGPFELEPGDQQLVVFAIVGGENLEHLRQNADVAQLVHAKGKSDAPEETHSAPRATRLMWNTPNPFARSTVVRFELSQSAEVDLSVHDVSGRRVRLLATGPTVAGLHALSWDGRDDAGRSVSSGIYFLRLRAENERVTRRIVVTR